MAALANPKHERFAQARFKGLTLEAAMAEAGYKPDRRNGPKLTTNHDIQARIAELQAGAAEACGETVEKLTLELNEALVFARAEQRADRMATVIMAKAKLHGLVIEKNELSGKDGAPLSPVINVSIGPAESAPAP